MAHWSQTEFVRKVSLEYPRHFRGTRVLEVGSHDVNGSVRTFFTDCCYTGLDVVPGKAVDVVCEAQKYNAPFNTFDVTISCECLEHNPEWIATFANMIRVTKPGGLVVMTCASPGRPIHGALGDMEGGEVNGDPKYYDCNFYYRNLEEADFTKLFDFNALFSSFRFELGTISCDLYFVGVRR